MCRLTLQLAGRRKTALAPTGGREQPLTTTWPTQTTSRKPTCSCTTSIGRLGRLKSCYGRGSRSGDRHLSLSPDDDTFRQEVDPDIPSPALSDGRVSVRMTAAGVTPLDHTILSGQYPKAKAPLVLGNEGAGIVEGGGTVEYPTGSRVMFTGPYGVLENGTLSQWLCQLSRLLIDDVSAILPRAQAVSR